MVLKETLLLEINWKKPLMLKAENKRIAWNICYIFLKCISLLKKFPSNPLHQEGNGV